MKNRCLNVFLSQIKSRSRCFAAAFFFLFLAGCTGTLPSVQERNVRAQHLALRDPALQPVSFADEPFPLAAWQSALSLCQGKDLHLYIEGDGLAWVSSSRVSSNPTPVNPLALKLAVADPYFCKIYLGRPGQYGSAVPCNNKYWTSHRFAAEVVDRYQAVLNELKKRYAVSSFTLFGYSGGGAIAALVAANREDVSLLVTVAGNLDTEFWSQSHRLSPLTGSLNPADFAKKLEGIPQRHLVGGRDKIVGYPVYKAYRSRFSDHSRLTYEVFETFDHHCCWDQVWKNVVTRLSP